ncbi:MAG TPA: LacI family DNA-binding transcriptional regulator [Phycisphaerae bacterium]|nr:LacI family DNA-binding transcriptional regulator [Phycisphaerales bacterium]HRX85538.1 LacI family DNA-binding transcriptional regulator [Phycisphaerae bacterium]
MASIEEIARRAKVSKTTVSFVINGKAGPSAETVRHVRRVISEMNYVPSALAQRFARSKSKTIALIVLPYPQVFRDPHHGDALDAVHETLRSQDYSLLLDTSRPEFVTQRRHLNLLQSGQVDGMLLLEPTLDQPYLRDLTDVPGPVVIINSDGTSLGLDFVRTDDVAIGRIGTEYLLQLGHRAIGFIAASSHHASARDRLTGFIQTMKANGMPTDSGRVFQGAFDTSFWSGHEGCTQILRDHPETTAIFCSNDTMALGALEAANKLSRKVPDTLSILGVDDNPTSGYCTPRLSTIRQPSHEVARQATHILLERLSGEPHIAPSPIQRVLPPMLVPRESCAPPPERHPRRK